MSYLGLDPRQQLLNTSTQYFSGNAAATQFTLSRNVASESDLDVLIGNVAQRPGIDYTAGNVTLLFSAPPASGTNNITVTFRGGALNSLDLSASVFEAGTVGAPSVVSVAANNTGFYWANATTLVATVAGANRATFNGQAASTSNVTGALTVTGGIGATGNINTSGLIRTTNTTESANVGSGALVIGGGAGITGNLNVGGDITCVGDFTVNGTFTTTGTDSLEVNDPFIFLANANPGDSFDIGTVGQYNDGTDRYTGFFRDITDGAYKLFSNLTVRPTTVVDTADASFVLADLELGTVSATGNVTGNYFIGNGSQLTGLVTTVSEIVNGASKVEIPSINGAITANVNGVTKANITAAGLEVVGNVSASILVSATGNVIGGNISTAGVITATGNVTSAANVSAGNVITGGLMSAVSTITGGNLATAGTASAGGNITGGNLLTTGVISATGNALVLGRELRVGADFSSFTTSSRGLIAINGTGDVILEFNTANITRGTVYHNGTEMFLQNRQNGALTFATNNTNRLSISSAGVVSAGGNITGGNITTTGVVTAGGSITGGNILTAGNIVITRNSAFGQPTVRFQDTDSSVSTGQTLGAIEWFTGDTSLGSRVTSVIRSRCSSTLANADVEILTSTSGAAATVKMVIRSTGNVGIGNTAPQHTLAVTGTMYLSSTLTAVGNITGGNITTAGRITATGNVTGGNITTTGLVSAGGSVSATANVTGGNVITGGIITATGNITGGNVITDGLITATGAIQSTANVVGGNINTAGVISVGGSVSATGNVTGGNITTAGRITATGNVISAANVAGGNVLATGNVNTAQISATGNIVAVANITGGNLFASTLSLSGNVVSELSITSNVTAGNVNSVGIVSSIGNVIGGNINTGGLVTATGNITGGNVTTSGRISAGVGITATGNITAGNLLPPTDLTGVVGTAALTWSNGQFHNFTVDGALTVNGTITLYDNDVLRFGTGLDWSLYNDGTDNRMDLLSGDILIRDTSVKSPTTRFTFGRTTGDFTATGNVTGGNLITAGLASLSSITKTGTDGVGNIGQSDNSFNTVFAKATSAQYADLAEMYVADADYAPGTVVAFGGAQEITLSREAEDARVAGVVSTNPSYLMNATQEGEHVIAVALTGRVPTRVMGAVRKGDLMVSAGDGAARSQSEPRTGSVIGKALEDHDGGAGMIEIVVGRL